MPGTLAVCKHWFRLLGIGRNLRRRKPSRPSISSTSSGGFHLLWTTLRDVLLVLDLTTISTSWTRLQTISSTVTPLKRGKKAKSILIRVPNITALVGVVIQYSNLSAHVALRLFHSLAKLSKIALFQWRTASPASKRELAFNVLIKRTVFSTYADCWNGPLPTVAFKRYFSQLSSSPSKLSGELPSALYSNRHSWLPASRIPPLNFSFMLRGGVNKSQSNSTTMRFCLLCIGNSNW